MLKKILFVFLCLLTFIRCTKDNNGNNSNSTTSADIKDIDGNIYPTIKICNQILLGKNLNVSKYSDGTEIPQVQDPNDWANLTTGAWCYYENNTNNGKVYGKLYNWYAVNDSRGLAPKGWHIPTDAEWTTLTNCLGGEAVAGGKLKSPGTDYWLSPNIDASNSSKFSALGAGGRFVNGNFVDLRKFGEWWTSSSESANSSYRRFISHDGVSVTRDIVDKRNGLSIRCVKD